MPFVPQGDSKPPGATIHELKDETTANGTARLRHLSRTSGTRFTPAAHVAVHMRRLKMTQPVCWT